MTSSKRTRTGLISQARSFFGAPYSLEPSKVRADVAFIGVPFGVDVVDGSTISKGPDALRDCAVYAYAGRYGGEPAVGYYDFDTDTEYLKGVTMVDAGDVAIGVRDLDGNYRRIRETVTAVVDRGAFPVVIGGSHSIAASAVQAFGRYSPVDVVHIDAHHDFYRQPLRGGDGRGALRRIVDEVDFVQDIATIGLRSGAYPQTGRDIYDDLNERGVKIFTARQFGDLGVESAIAAIPDSRRNVYVTLDIDVVDTAHVLENPWRPGGLTYQQVSALLRGIARRRNIVGMDVASVSPGGQTAMVAGQLILDLLSERFSRR